MHRVDPLLDHLSDIAVLEALSVAAFTQLGHDLGRHAPGFLPRVRRARRDERRHARNARAILRALGREPPPLPPVFQVSRNLFRAALDNAVEGCVHETFGAVVVTAQAKRAKNRALRGFFESIAPDEIQHAELSWEVHDELFSRLTEDERAHVSKAQLDALSAIERMPALPERVREAVGGLRIDERKVLVGNMRDALVSACVS